jgi:Protein of unknown function (DUF739).
MHENESLLNLFEHLADYCQAHKVISEGELRVKIRECVNSVSEAEREELERKLGGNLEDLIFKSITTREDKISVFSPDMHTRINYQGELFYCLPTHRYLNEELEAAFLRWTKIRSPLSALKTVVMDFMERSGYQLKKEKRENEHLELVMGTTKDKRRRMHLFIFPSITFLPSFMAENPACVETSEDAENVIVVPTEKTPAPFISFFRQQDAGHAMIWIADAAKSTIDPFIGNPEDEAIEHNFAHPEQARRAVSVWMRRMHVVEL